MCKCKYIIKHNKKCKAQANKHKKKKPTTLVWIHLWDECFARIHHGKNKAIGWWSFQIS